MKNYTNEEAQAIINNNKDQKNMYYIHGYTQTKNQRSKTIINEEYLNTLQEVNEFLRPIINNKKLSNYNLKLFKQVKLNNNGLFKYEQIDGCYKTIEDNYNEDKWLKILYYDLGCCVDNHEPERKINYYKQAIENRKRFLRGQYNKTNI